MLSASAPRTSGSPTLNLSAALTASFSTRWVPTTSMFRTTFPHGVAGSVRVSAGESGSPISLSPSARARAAAGRGKRSAAAKARVRTDRMRGRVKPEQATRTRDLRQSKSRTRTSPSVEAGEKKEPEPRRDSGSRSRGQSPKLLNGNLDLVGFCSGGRGEGGMAFLHAVHVATSVHARDLVV